MNQKNPPPAKPTVFETDEEFEQRIAAHVEHDPAYWLLYATASMLSMLAAFAAGRRKKRQKRRFP